MNVIAFTDRFARGTYDEVWLREVRERNWLLFTRDDRWRSHRAELMALISVRARAFIFTSQGSAEEIAHLIWVSLPKIAAIADDDSIVPPYIYKVTSRGLMIVYPSEKFRFPMPR